MQLEFLCFPLLCNWELSKVAFEKSRFTLPVFLKWRSGLNFLTQRVFREQSSS